MARSKGPTAFDARTPETMFAVSLIDLRAQIEAALRTLSDLQGNLERYRVARGAARARSKTSMAEHLASILTHTASASEATHEATRLLSNLPAD